MIVKNLSVSYNSNSIIDKVNFTLNQDDRIGLVGLNGSGKTTLLKALAGVIPIQSGSVSLNNQTIGFLKQEIDLSDYNLSIINYIKKETRIDIIEKRLHELENTITEENMDEYATLLDYFLAIDGYNFDENLKFILDGLNLKEDVNFKVGNLSGGEKIKVLLAVVLLSNPDIMLLDEPTNNIDYNSILFLENYLGSSSSKMIIVSHDEEFLNRIVNKIFLLENGKIKEYNMTYNNYLMTRENEYANELRNYEQLQEKRKELKKKIEETSSWASKGAQGKKKTDNDKLSRNYSKERSKKTSGKISQLNRELESLKDISFVKKEDLSFDICYDNGKGNKDIYVYDLVCGYDSFKTDEINMDIPFGTRVNITGSNGSGKTTFIKTLLGQIKPVQGNINIGNYVIFGYMSQNTIDSESDLTIYEYLTNNLEDVDDAFLFALLNRFHINYEDRNKKYIILSPGERAKVNIVKLALNKVNVLILDEVTNHLDVETINMICEVVCNFKGTIINISHNRKFNEILNADIVFNIEKH